MKNNDNERDKIKKSILSKTEKELQKQKLKKSESQDIFQRSDALTPEQLKRRNEEKEKTVIQLIGGDKTSIKKILDLIEDYKQPYKPHFGYEKDFYKSIYELNRWPVQEHRNFVKRKEVATWTRQLIYGRFPPGVFDYLKKKNPFLFAYIRKHKYFMYLSPEGQNELDTFINDFLQMRMGYDNWDRFEKDYCNKYGIQRQQKLDE